MSDQDVCGRCHRALPQESLERDFAGICPHCLGGLLAREEKRGPAWASGSLTPFDLDHAPLKAGDTFLSYQILEIVARGGMGYVYRAKQTPLNRIVALKILAPELASSESFRARFDREAKILAALNHPHIVQVFDFGRERDLLFLSMEHVEGTDLQTIFDQNERLDRLKLLTIIRDVARGLRRIHEAGLVHRDIKPANILITSGGQAKIADFGIAIESQESERLTETGTFIGTPHYVSPEHVQAKRVDGRSDLYSLGCILYQGLSGRTPFTAPSPTALLLKHVQEPPAPLWKGASGIPPALGELVRKLLAKNPAARPDSAQYLERELDRLIQGMSQWQSIDEPKAIPLEQAPAPGPRSPLRSPKVLAIAAGAALVLVALLCVLLFRGKDEDPVTTEPSEPKPVPATAQATPDPVKPEPEVTEPARIPAETVGTPSSPSEFSALSPPERRRRLELLASTINLAGVAAVYADLKTMPDEGQWLRRNMTKTQERVQTLVEVMQREGQNATVDDTLRPTDTLLSFDGQLLEKIGKDASTALLGTFVAKVKAGSRALVTVRREGVVEEFVIRFDERPKDLQMFVQIVGLIPGQEVTASTASPSPAPTPPPVPAAPVTPAPPIPVPVAPASPVPAPVVLKRAPMPNPEVLKDAERLIRDVFKDDFAKKTPLDKLSLAKKLLKHGIEAKENGADTFILLRECRELAIQQSDADTAFKSVAETARRFEINEPDLKFATLGGISKTAKTTDEHGALARAYGRFVDEAMAVEDYDLAEKAAAAGGQAARKGKDIPLVAKLDARARECAELKLRAEKNRRARETIAKNPDDIDARNTLGQYLCLVRGDWAAGLEHLQRGSHLELKAAAVKDLAKPVDPVEQTAVGDLWWDLSDKEKGRAQEQLRRRALFWYDQALPRTSGVVKTRVTQRLAAVGLGGVSVGLVGHWKMDEGDGATIADYSGNNRSGRIEGARWVKGVQGTALYLDGQQSRVHIDAGPVVVPWSASVWVSRESSGNVAGTMVDSRDYNGTSLRLEQSPGTHKVGITKYGAADLTFEYQAPEGVWVHLTYVATEKGISLYANGALIGTVTQFFALHLDKLGAHENNSMKGYLDDLRIYSRALTAVEIEKLYQYGKH